MWYLFGIPRQWKRRQFKKILGWISCVGLQLVGAPVETRALGWTKASALHFLPDTGSGWVFSRLPRSLGRLEKILDHKEPAFNLTITKGIETEILGCAPNSSCVLCSQLATTYTTT